jgi:hypothetical protein
MNADDVMEATASAFRENKPPPHLPPDVCPEQPQRSRSQDRGTETGQSILGTAADRVRNLERSISTSDGVRLEHLLAIRLIARTQSQRYAE